MAALVSAQLGGTGDGYAASVKAGDERRIGGAVEGRPRLNSVPVCPMCGERPTGLGRAWVTDLHQDGDRWAYETINPCRRRGTHFHRRCFHCGYRWVEWP